MSSRSHLSVVSDIADAATPADEAAPRASVIQLTDAVLQYPVGPYVRGSIKANIMRLFGHREAAGETRYVTALKGLNLTIRHGERVGVIGRNGSGKSSLLRVIGGIYPLISGRVDVVGEIGALLDVSLGFETESTGRENIYYRGMALGLDRKQIEAMEPGIVAFADLGKFIDLPMRTYSAGMSVRLGFAISTEQTPDVLLVDEVFGAGDAVFAARALERMTQVVEAAGVVVMAGHDMALMQQVCDRVIWLKDGRVEADGDPQATIAAFVESMQAGSAP